jgi:hypothetical protein
MHICMICEAMIGDNFIYPTGFQQADEVSVDTTVEALEMTICGNGHLEQVGQRRWPKGSSAMRPARVVGAIGGHANLFETTSYVAFSPLVPGRIRTRQDNLGVRIR